jgi:hypothetical protein
MGGNRFRRYLVTIMMLLMLFLIVLNANIALPPSLPPSFVLIERFRRTGLVNLTKARGDVLFILINVHQFWKCPYNTLQQLNYVK